MLFTWSTKNLCIIFRGWRITGPFSLLLSLIAIVLLTAGYEGVRRLSRRYETAHVQRLKAYSATPVTGGKSIFYLDVGIVISLFICLCILSGCDSGMCRLIDFLRR